jgi:protein-S-isoprenylcysteine O-methyltransferase Ste14
MPVTFEFLPTLVFVVVMLCWVVFAGTFVLRRLPQTAPSRKRDRSSIVGLVLQGLSYAVIWALHRPAFTPIAASRPLSVAASIVGLVLAVGSVILITRAVRTLGKEWSLTARVLEGHHLATTGPYAYVRHPIYTGMLGLLLATGIAISHWAALIAGALLLFVGTMIRVRSEERLLRETFGQEFEEYARRVSAILPGL